MRYLPLLGLLYVTSCTTASQVKPTVVTPVLETRVQEHYDGGEELRHRCIKKRKDSVLDGRTIRSQIETEIGNYCSNPGGRPYIINIEYDDLKREIKRTTFFSDQKDKSKDVTTTTYNPNNSIREKRKISYSDERASEIRLDFYLSGDGAKKTLTSGNIDNEEVIVSGNITTFDSSEKVENIDFIDNGKLRSEDRNTCTGELVCLRFDNPDVIYTVTTPLTPDINLGKK